MKLLLTILALSIATSTAPAVDPGNPQAPKQAPADKIREPGVKTPADLQSYLIAAPLWTVERPRFETDTIEFRANGKLTHTLWIGTWSVTGNRTVTLRRSSNHESGKLKFSDDLTTYEGLWQKDIRIHGKPKK